MAAAKTYVVPLDFSETSEVALDHAIKLARGGKGKLLLIHVITDPGVNVPPQFRSEYYEEVKEESKDQMKKLARRKRLKPGEYRFVLERGGDPARVIAGQAKKSRAFMIVMGSHGRAGLTRLILGSVAEKTLRYAECPVLIVK